MPRAHHILIDDLIFPEGPRWHEGEIWFSDMHAHTVYRTAKDSDPEACARDRAGRIETFEVDVARAGLP
jgi:hypothetical protein